MDAEITQAEAAEKSALAAERELEILVEQLLPLCTKADLRPEYAAKVTCVEANGCGVCGRCKWLFGCDRCSPEKAFRYWLMHEIKDELKAKRCRPKK